MALVFDTAAKRIILDRADISAQQIYSAWADWAAAGDNLKWLPAFRSVGGDDLGGGLAIPPYYFLTHGWRVRPMEADQTLTVTGNLFVDGGGNPVVQTLGAFRVLVNLVVPVQAQAFSTTGSTGPTPSAIAGAVRAELGAELLRILELAKIHGLVPSVPLVNDDAGRRAGDVVQTITVDGDGAVITERVA